METTKRCVGDVVVDGGFVRELLEPGQSAAVRFWDKLEDRALFAAAGVASAQGRIVKAFSVHQGQHELLVAEALCVAGELVQFAPRVRPLAGDPDRPTPNAYALPDGRILPMPQAVATPRVIFDLGGRRTVQAVRVDAAVTDFRLAERDAWREAQSINPPAMRRIA